MRESRSSSISLAGSLLIAHPNLRDSNFAKTVLFLSAHSVEDGAFGLTLNRPSGRTVAEFLPDRDLGRLAGVPVFLGGPVSTDQLIFASFHWSAEAERMECRHHLVIDEAEQAAAEMAVVRAFVGYAGWSPGQIEAEIASSSWLTLDVDPALIFGVPAEGMWEAALQRLGTNPATLQTSSGVH